MTASYSCKREQVTIPFVDISLKDPFARETFVELRSILEWMELLEPLNTPIPKLAILLKRVKCTVAHACSQQLRLTCIRILVCPMIVIKNKKLAVLKLFWILILWKDWKTFNQRDSGETCPRGRMRVQKCCGIESRGKRKSKLVVSRECAIKRRRRGQHHFLYLWVCS